MPSPAMTATRCRFTRNPSRGRTTAVGPADVHLAATGGTLQVPRRRLAAMGQKLTLRVAGSIPPQYAHWLPAGTSRRAPMGITTGGLDSPTCNPPGRLPLTGFHGERRGVCLLAEQHALGRSAVDHRAASGKLRKYAASGLVSATSRRIASRTSSGSSRRYRALRQRGAARSSRSPGAWPP